MSKNAGNAEKHLNKLTCDGSMTKSVRLLNAESRWKMPKPSVKKQKPFSGSVLADYPLEFEDMPMNKRLERRKAGLQVKKPVIIKVSDRGKSKKDLTNLKKGSIIEPVNKAKRKDDKMATDKTNKTKKGNATRTLKSIVWLAFAVQQAFIGYVLLTNFDNYFVIVSALVSLGIAGVIVAVHFVKAHK